MRQPTPTLPITPKMLRHFAIVTVAITACIGVFAQGENAKIASNPKQGATQGSGSSFAAVAGDKNSREVNGMKLAAGTRLQSGGGSDADEPPAQVADGIGYFQNNDPAFRASSPPGTAGAPAEVALAPSPAPPPIPRDANGVPAPGAALSARNPANAAKPPTTRRVTQQDIDRMMAAESLRSGGAIND